MELRVLQSIGSVARETGGPARSSQGLCVGLNRCGCETWLLSHTPKEQAWMTGLTNFLTPERSGYRGSLEALERAIKEIRPDVIQSNGLWSPYTHAAAVSARRYGIPLVIAPRGTLSSWAMNHKKWRKRLAWWLYQRMDLTAAAAFHVTSEEEAAQVRAQGLRQPIIFLPNGVDVPDLDLAKVRRCEDVKTVLYLGRIHFQKGLRELIQAWARVRSSKVELETGNWELETGESESHTHARTHSCTNEIPWWRLELVGPDVNGHKACLERMVKEYGMTDSVQFPGAMDDDDKWDAYARADVFVLPSYTENFGLSIAEALCAGLPVVTTKGTPWSELLSSSESSLVHYCESAVVGGDSLRPETGGQRTEGRCALVGEDGRRTEDSERGLSFIPHPSSLAANGRCGWWIDIGVEPLVVALREAMSLSDEERYRMGLNGRRLVESKYTWPAIAEHMKAAYAWILNGGTPPDCVRTL